MQLILTDLHTKVLVSLVQQRLDILKKELINEDTGLPLSLPYDDAHVVQYYGLINLLALLKNR